MEYKGSLAVENKFEPNTHTHTKKEHMAMSILFCFRFLEKYPPRKLLLKSGMLKFRHAKKSGMLTIRYAKNTYGPKCPNTHLPKLWLLQTWALGPWAVALGSGPPPGK